MDRVRFPIDGVTGLWLIFPGPADMIYIQPDRLAAQPLELLKIVDEFQVKAVSLSTSIAARKTRRGESRRKRRSGGSANRMQMQKPTKTPATIGPQAMELEIVSGRNDIRMRGKIRCMPTPRTAPNPAPNNPMAAVWTR